jgi:imidazolonepropionase-like amidohydrolase
VFARYRPRAIFGRSHFDLRLHLLRIARGDFLSRLVENAGGIRQQHQLLGAEMLRQGTTTLECKSGYGLTVDDERRSVAAAAGITREVTFLGAHVVPPEFESDPGAYLDLVCGPMLAACGTAT